MAESPAPLHDARRLLEVRLLVQPAGRGSSLCCRGPAGLRGGDPHYHCRLAPAQPNPRLLNQPLPASCRCWCRWCTAPPSSRPCWRPPSPPRWPNCWVSQPGAAVGGGAGVLTATGACPTPARGTHNSISPGGPGRPNPFCCAPTLPGVVVGKAASADDGGEVAHVCTMAMEVVVALCSTEVRPGAGMVGWVEAGPGLHSGAGRSGALALHACPGQLLCYQLAAAMCAQLPCPAACLYCPFLQICLDPLASKEQQQLEDMPSVAEVGGGRVAEVGGWWKLPGLQSCVGTMHACSAAASCPPGLLPNHAAKSCCLSHYMLRTSLLQAAPLARALLELLPGMGANAQLAHRVLRLLAGAGGCEQVAGNTAATTAVHCMSCPCCASSPPPSVTLPCAPAAPLQSLAARRCAAAQWPHTLQPPARSSLSARRAPLP